MSGSPSTRKSRRTLIAVVVVAVVVAVLLIPPLLAGSFMVRVSTVTFKTITGSLGYSAPFKQDRMITAYEYYLTFRGKGVLSTDESNVSTSRGSANVTMKLVLMNPSNQTLDLGTFHFTGGIGTRNHTVNLSFDQGLRAPGDYVLTMTLTADVAPVGGLLQTGLYTYFSLHWTVS